MQKGATDYFENLAAMYVPKYTAPYPPPPKNVLFNTHRNDSSISRVGKIWLGNKIRILGYYNIVIT
jgi:hypothetical protein